MNKYVYYFCVFVGWPLLLLGFGLACLSLMATFGAETTTNCGLASLVSLRIFLFSFSIFGFLLATWGTDDQLTRGCAVIIIVLVVLLQLSELIRKNNPTYCKNPIQEKIYEPNQFDRNNLMFHDYNER